ncbi:MAG: PKD domain-containing protein [Flavobacteriales bacterium]
MRSADPFEKSLKQALDQYEVPYNSADWAKLQNSLDQQKGPAWQASAGLYALLLGGSLAIGTSLHLLFNQPPTPQEYGISALALELEEDAPSLSLPTETELLTVADQNDMPSGDVEVVLAAEPDETPAASVVEKRSGGRSIHPAIEPKTPQSEAPSSRTRSSELAVRVSTSEGCPGTTIDFGLDNSSENGIYLWNFGDGSFSNQARPSHTFSKAGTYEVMLSHSAVGGGSIMNRPVSDPIVIYEAPEAVFSHIKREFPNTIPSVHFENRSVGGQLYIWDFGDGSTSTAVHTDHVYKEKGTYSVVLTVTNGKGCVDRTERTVRVENDYDLHAPKTFSPNNDGVEDTFLPEALKTLGAKFALSVMDKSTGQVVYETSDAARPWNGRIGNKGEPCAVGDYVWMVEMKDGKDGGTFNGQVRLLH